MNIEKSNEGEIKGMRTWQYTQPYISENFLRMFLFYMSSISEQNKRLSNANDNLNCLFQEAVQISNSRDTSFVSPIFNEFLVNLQTIDLQQARERLEAVANLGKRLVKAEDSRRNHQKAVDSSEFFSKNRESSKKRKLDLQTHSYINPFKKALEETSKTSAPNPAQLNQNTPNLCETPMQS